MRVRSDELSQKGIKEIKKIYDLYKEDIKKRLNEFKWIGKNENKKEIFGELIFCLLTPQSKAKNCWERVREMMREDFLLEGTLEEIQNKLKGVRFKYKKSEYIIETREKFFTKKNSIYSKIKKIETSQELRDYLKSNVKGLGWKESSHFLRNIGRGSDFAILDRHILKNLKNSGVIAEIPENFSEKKYKEIEKKMRRFSQIIDIPMDHLDLTLWAKETGEVFK